MLELYCMDKEMFAVGRVEFEVDGGEDILIKFGDGSEFAQIQAVDLRGRMHDKDYKCFLRRVFIANSFIR